MMERRNSSRRNSPVGLKRETFYRFKPLGVVVGDRRESVRSQTQVPKGNLFLESRSGYRPALRYCASLLIVDEPSKKSDAIVVLAGGEPGRPWGAADLYNRGLADYVIVTRDQVQPEEAELVQRGIDLVDGRGNYIRVLRGLGVPNEKIVSVEKAAGDTVSEMQQIRKLCLDRNWHSLIIVTANYHTRRARMAARYVLGPEFKFAVSATPHGGLNSREWWTSRSDYIPFLI